MKKLVGSQFIEFITVFRNAVDKNQTVLDDQFDEALLQVETLNIPDETEPNVLPQKEEKKITKKIFIFFPLTIPATGKSVFIETLKQTFVNGDTNNEETKDAGQHQKMEFLSVSSDETRRRIINDYMLKNPKASQQDAFKSSDKGYAQAYENQINEMIKKSDVSKQAQVIVFFDKNHPLNAIGKPIDLFQKYFNKKPEVQIITIGLLPETQMSHEDYPFSLSYLLTCIKRAINRQNHETLVGDELHIASVVLKFFTFFKHQSKNLDSQFDIVLKCPFVIDFELSPESSDFLESFLPLCDAAKKPEDIVEYYPVELKQCIAYAKACDWGYPNKDKQISLLTSMIKK